MFGQKSLLRHRFLQFVVTLVLITSMNLSALPPSWWHEPDSSGRRVVDPTVTSPNHSGPANIGQAKFMAKRALHALHAQVPSVANEIEADLVGPGKIIPTWDVPAAGSDLAKEQYSPLRIGQLKAIAAPFYRHLNDYDSTWLNNQLQMNQTKDPGDSTNYFPWTFASSDDRNQAIANIGQLKAVFSLHFDSLSDPDIVTNDDMARLSVVGRMLVKVTDSEGDAVEDVNLQFSRLSGNGGFPGGVTSTYRVTNGAGLVNAGDYISPEGDLIRVSMHTPQGTQSVWLPANVSEPGHIVRTGSGGFQYSPPAVLTGGGDEPPPEQPQVDPPDEDPETSPSVGKFLDYLSYTGIWSQTTTIPGQKNFITKTLVWNPAVGHRTIYTLEEKQEDGHQRKFVSDSSGTLMDIMSEPNYAGYEVNADVWLKNGFSSVAIANMTVTAQPPLGFNRIDVEHSQVWANTYGRGVAERKKVQLTSASSELMTSPAVLDSLHGQVTSAIGPFISRGPNDVEGFDNEVTWGEISSNRIKLKQNHIKSMRAEVIADGAGCNSAIWGTRWEVSSSNTDILVSIRGLYDTGFSYGEIPESTSFTSPDDSGIVTEVRLKSRGDEAGARSKITLSFLNGDGSVIVQKSFEVYVPGGSTDSTPPRYSEGLLTKTMSNDESTGPKYRKIALDGRPLADEKPQATSETDEEDEETYVDALTRELRHSTTDIYVPVPGSDLALSVKRNIVSEIWNPTSGLCPHEDPTLAFGPVWRTNLAANVHIIEQVDRDTDPSNLSGGLTGLGGGITAKLQRLARRTKGITQTDPNYAFVTDEDGASHRFMIGYRWPDGGGLPSRYYVPAPTSKLENGGHEVSLTGGGTSLVLKKRHGNTLVFEHCVGFPIDRVRMAGIGPGNGTTNGGELPPTATEWGGGVTGLVHGNGGDLGTFGSGQYQAYSYFRLVSVTDRFGTKLEYIYESGENDDMVPKSIRVEGRPELAIHIVSAGGKIQRVYDPNGNEIVYHYAPNHTLEKATVDNVPIAKYGYKRWEEADYKKDVSTGAFDPKLLAWAKITRPAEGGQPASAQLFQYGEKIQHFDLAEISDAVGNRYKFTYEADKSHLMMSSSELVGPGTGLYTLGTELPNAPLKNKGPCRVTYPLSGYPPDVTKIELPGGGSVRIGDSADIPSGSGAAGQFLHTGKHTTVKDAENNRRTYSWNEQITVKVDQVGLGYQQEFSMGRPASINEVGGSSGLSAMVLKDSASTATHTFYTEMTISHDAGGEETYRFSPLAGGGLASVVDMSGHLTSYLYGTYEIGEYNPSEVLPPAVAGGVTPPLSTKPAVQIDPAERRTYFIYGPHEMMTKRLDFSGLVRDFGVDAWGRTTREWVTDLNLTTLADTEIAYSPSLKGFPVRRTIKNTGDFVTPQDGVQPLTTLYKADPLGRVEIEASDMNGNNLIDAGDLETSYIYDRNGNKLSVTDPAGNVTWFHYDKRNRLIGVVYPDGTEKTSVYDTRGKKVLERDEKGIATGYVYDQRGRMTKSIRDMNGNLSHSTNGLVGIDPGIDLIQEKVYDKLGSVTQSKDARGYITVTEYDHLRRPVRTIAPGGTRSPGQVPTGGSVDEVTSLYYDGVNSGSSCFASAGFKPTKVVDPRGYATVFTYDEFYQCIGTLTQYSLSPKLFARKTNHYRSANGFLYRVEEPRRPFDEVGNPTGAADAGGRLTLMTEDKLLRVSKVEEKSLGHETPGYTGKTSETQTLYTATGLVRKTTRKLDESKVAETDMEYDRAGRLTKVISPSVSIDVNGVAVPGRPEVSTTYGPSGLVVESKDAGGAVTSFIHDSRGRLLQQISPAVLNHDSVPPQTLSPLITTTYDKVGNAIKVTDPRGYSTVTDYDAANRAWKVTAPSYLDSQTSQQIRPVTVTAYDRSGNVTSVTDPRGSVTINTYDARGRLTQTKTNPAAPASSTVHAEDLLTHFEWDMVGNRIKVVDAGGQHTSFEYDGLNRLTSTVWDSNDVARMKTESSVYDALVQISKTDPRECRTDYEYGDRLLMTRSISTGVSSAGIPGHDESRAYDHAGRLLSITGVDDVLKNVSYVLDDLDRVTQETSAGYPHSYKYDRAGNRTRVLYGKTGRLLVSAYDSLGRLSSLTDSSRVTGYKYDLASNVLQRTQANGTVEINAYNSLGRRISQRTMTSETGTTPVSSFGYSYDPLGNLTRIEEKYSSTTVPDRILVNTYDRVNRLLTENADSLTPSQTVGKSVLTTYSYSKANNRAGKTVQVTEGGAVVSNDAETFVYGNAGNGKNSNQLHSHTKGANTTTYTYDESGNRKTTAVNGNPKETYGWDARNRLISLEQASPSKIYSYGYDYRSRRVIRDEDDAGGERAIVSFSGGTSAFEVVGTTTKVEYIRGSDYGGGIGGIMYSLRGTTPAPRFNAYNGRGDVVAQTNAAGTVTWQATYEAFGTRTKENGGENLDRQKANTKEEDPTGLLNEGFRYRDLVTGAFISRDPLGFIDGPNVYSYVRENPWSSFDPLGLEGFGIRQDRQIQRQLGATNYEWDSARENASKIFTGAIQVIAGFIPWVGDALDAKDVVHPSSAPSERVIGGVSLGANMWTAGLAPNAGPIVRGARDTGEAIDDIVDIFRDADRALDDAMNASQREIKESQADAMRDMAAEGLMPNPMARGRANEVNKLEQLGETKNKEIFSTSEGNTIPDINNSTELGDIKDARILSDDAQMRAQREAASRADKEHVVHTGTHTKITKPMEESSTRIERHDDLGPQSDDP